MGWGLGALKGMGSKMQLLIQPLTLSMHEVDREEPAVMMIVVMMHASYTQSVCQSVLNCGRITTSTSIVTNRNRGVIAVFTLLVLARAPEHLSGLMLNGCLNDGNLIIYIIIMHHIIMMHGMQEAQGL